MSMLRRYERILRSGGGGVAYDLLDQFLTDRAAGAVNGTQAEPTGGVRTVVDTESKLSLSGGKATFSGGKASPAYGDPGLWEAAITRTVGKLIFVHFNSSTLSNRILVITVDVDQAGAGTYTFLLNGTINIQARGGQAVMGAGLAANTDYIAIFALNSTGCQQFLYGGAYTVPKLLYRDPQSNAATLYPGLVGFSAVWVSDYIKSPVNLWLARPLASDGFASSFGTTDGLGHVDASSSLGSGGGGLTWTQQAGTWTVAIGKANASALSGGLAIATIPTASKDVFVSADLTRSGGNVGIVARYADADNYLRAYHDGTNVVLEQVLAGTPSTLMTAAKAYSANARLELALDGNNAQLWYNHSRVNIVSTVDPSLTATAHGLYSTNTGNTLDNFSVWAVGTGGEYSASLTPFFSLNSINLLVVGDSKSDSAGWQNELCKELNINSPSSTWQIVGNDNYAISGATVASIKTYVDANLAAETFTAHKIVINLGANDVGSLPAEATWKANLTSIINSFRAKWNCDIYISRVWRRNFASACDTVAGWIEDVVATYQSGVYVADDERDWLEGGDDGATMTTDGIHYSAAGQTEKVNQMKAVFGI